MIKYVLKRLVILIPIVIALTFFVFTILYMTPGDPTEIILGSDYTEEASIQLKQELGLDQPFLVQYATYLTNLARGNFGISYITRAPVGEQLAARFPNTFKIVIAAMIFCVVVGMPIGIRSATKPDSLFSKITMVIGLMGVSMPVFWLGLLLILLFSVHLGWLPSSGMDNGFKSLILPAVTVGANYMANTMRTTRSSMLESIRQDYIRTARAKGVSERDVIYDHALGNALMPTITVVGLNVGALLGGVVYCETVFSIPGTGRLLVESINKRDAPCVLGCLVIMAICVAVSNLIVDLIYAYIDPRIKAQYSKGGGR
ncbi:ABC transporter permease [Clostridium sp. AM58-1XD]|uniref:ABC transporter permease n=1 Tax=Clostridium sp. AM58-1XD TaxID=2292307 RepID=UPI000E4BA3AA|nr:ABC transporter permease [Clostridium sp. AM58-1XD]RGY96197.1 ABC transporter permease [Clostridium sp. AM58-1XD]